MSKCPICYTWLTSCPCCDVFFCPDCKSTEDELEEELYDEEEDEAE